MLRNKDPKYSTNANHLEIARMQTFANYPSYRASYGYSGFSATTISPQSLDDQDDQNSVSTTEPGLEAFQRCSYPQQNVFPLLSLPTEVLAMILRHLSPNESLHCGLSCRRLYSIHFDVYSKVPLELKANFDASEGDQGSSVFTREKDRYPHLWRKRVDLGLITKEGFLQEQRDDVLSKPLLAPPVHALFPKQKKQGSIAQSWGFVGVREEIISGVWTVKQEIKMLNDYRKYYYADGTPPYMRQMPKCGCVLFKPKSQWCSRCKENQNTKLWEWKESDGNGNGNIVSFICRVEESDTV